MIQRDPNNASWRWAALAVLAIGGCSEAANSGYDAVVQGTVTIDGELATGGTVSFFPVGDGPAAVSSIAADGTYALRIGQGNASNPDSSKMPSGKYVAAVEVTGPPGKALEENAGGPLPAGPRLMADKYASQETSGLEFEVVKGMNVFELKLDGPWANPPEELADDEEDGEDEDAAADAGEENDDAPAGDDDDATTEEEPADAAPAAADEAGPETEGQP